MLIIKIMFITTLTIALSSFLFSMGIMIFITIPDVLKDIREAKEELNKIKKLKKKNMGVKNND